MPWTGIPTPLMRLPQYVGTDHASWYDHNDANQTIDQFYGQIHEQYGLLSGDYATILENYNILNNNFQSALERIAILEEFQGKHRTINDLSDLYGDVVKIPTKTDKLIDYILVHKGRPSELYPNEWDNYAVLHSRISPLEGTSARGYLEMKALLTSNHLQSFSDFVLSLLPVIVAPGETDSVKITFPSATELGSVYSTPELGTRLNYYFDSPSSDENRYDKRGIIRNGSGTNGFTRSFFDDKFYYVAGSINITSFGAILLSENTSNTMTSGKSMILLPINTPISNSNVVINETSQLIELLKRR